MINSLIRYYSKNLTNYALVFKYCKLVYWIFLSILFIDSIVLPLLLVSFFVKNYWTYGLLGISTLSISTFAIFLYLNAKAKSILSSVYKIKPTNLLWICEEFESTREKRLIAYLEKKCLWSNEKVNHMISILQNEEQRLKFKPLIVQGLFLSLFIPVWVQFIGVIYKLHSTVEWAIAIILVFLYISVVVTGFISYSKNIYNEFIDPIIDRKRQLIRELIYDLNMVILKLPEKNKLK